MRHLDAVQLVDMAPSTSPAGCAEEDRLAKLKQKPVDQTGEAARNGLRPNEATPGAGGKPTRTE